MPDHHGICTQFALDPEVIFNSHAGFINSSTKEFTLVNKAILSYRIAFEHLLLQDNPSHIVNLTYRYNIQYQYKSNGPSSQQSDIIIDRTLCNYMT